MTQNFEASMANVARGYASTATRLAKGFAPNKHLKDSIKSTVEIGQGKYIIRVRASGPDARAREYGSGVWARRGPKGYITIKPKNKKALAFVWEKGKLPLAYNPATQLPAVGFETGVAVLKKVQHPGVEAANGNRGYIHPAINETNKFIRKRIKEEGKKGIILDLKDSFRTR